MAKILIIDDEPFILESLEMFLSEKGHEIFKAADGTEGLSLFERHRPVVVILDIRLPDISGFEVMETLNRKTPAPKIIMITAYHDMETAIRSMKQGAFDYIYKPLDADQVESTVERALQVVSVETEAASGAGPVPEEPPLEGVIIGNSRPMLDIFKTIGVLCRNRATALIEGETGTGKELVARVIHRNSPFCEEPFMTMDCAATVETLIESELFGHEKGAFTGAAHCKKGKIELAGGGTLFLDEIGELPMNLQGKFLGFLERLEYMRVGGQVPLQSRCRIIAATNRDLANMTRKGSFRKDLYYRLKVVTIAVPPLRERRGDIPDLARHFLKKAHAELNTGVVRFQPGMEERLMSYSWPGNVRELENVILAAAVRARGNVILSEDIDRILSAEDRTGKGAEPAPSSLSHLERDHILDILHQVGWVRTKAAQVLGISLPTLRSKMRKYGIEPSKGSAQ
jgi:two-component system response regulator AtoC